MWDLDTITKLNAATNLRDLKDAESAAFLDLEERHRAAHAEIASLIRGVLDDSESLALDNPKDRAVLLHRLLEVL